MPTLYNLFKMFHWKQTHFSHSLVFGSE